MIDGRALWDFFAISDQEHFRQEHRSWVNTELKADAKKRNSLWRESLAVGSESFVERILQQLGVRAKSRSVVSEKEGNALKETKPLITSFLKVKRML